MNTLLLVKQYFYKHFNSSPIYVRAPGRINLAGEHLDYNLGFVLPAAIDKEIYLAVAINGQRSLSRFYAVDFNEYIEVDNSCLKPLPNHWSNYLTGVINELQLFTGRNLNGFDCVVAGQLPRGAGLASSAALECGLAFALNQLFDLQIDKMQLAKLCMQAENNFAGVKCGILDQFSSLFGKKNHAMYFDCKTFEHHYIPFDLDNYSVLLFNTNIQHSLAESNEFNMRVASCNDGVDAMQIINPQVTCLRDSTLDELFTVKNSLSEKTFNRCRYIIEEVERYKKATSALKKNDIHSFAKLLYETHNGLKNLYEISCYELDVLVDFALTKSEILGAKMMGGGYGGCTVNIVAKNSVNQLSADFKSHYKLKTNKELLVHEVSFVDGVGEIKV